MERVTSEQFFALFFKDVHSLLASDVNRSSPNPSRDLRQGKIVAAVQHGLRDSNLQEIFPSLPDNPDGNGKAVVP
jgi:hypothetical protein